MKIESYLEQRCRKGRFLLGSFFDTIVQVHVNHCEVSEIASTLYDCCAIGLVPNNKQQHSDSE